MWKFLVFGTLSYSNIWVSVSGKIKISGTKISASRHMQRKRALVNEAMSRAKVDCSNKLFTLVF